jgi:Ca-activated chloride channel family protein
VGGRQRSEVTLLTGFLTRPATQTWIAQNTYRRPMLANASRTGTFPPLQPIAVPRHPGLLTTLSGIYRDTFHYPSRTVFVLDTSGSMRGAGMQSLRRAFRSLNANIATSRWRDAEILVIPFSSKPAPTRQVTVRTAAPGDGLARLAAIVGKTHAQGGTGLYSALQQADEEIVKRNADGAEAVTSIILITDGKSTAGPGMAGFVRHRSDLEQTRCTPRNRELCHTPVYPILIGKAEMTQMQALAEATGGSVYNARQADLSLILQRLTARY